MRPILPHLDVPREMAQERTRANHTTDFILHHLHTERFSTAARTLGIWVLELKPTPNEGIAEVKFEAV